jgi:hypothetical protein
MAKVVNSLVKFIFLVVSLFFSLQSVAVVRYELKNIDFIVVIDGWNLPVNSFNSLLSTIHQQTSRRPNRQNVFKSIISNRVLVAHLKGKTGKQKTPVETIVDDKIISMDHLVKSGVISEIHSADPVITEQAKLVSDAEITAYYQRNTLQFKQVDEVKAQHIRLATQQQADEVYSKLKETSPDFSQAVKQYSTAADKTLALPGDLGLIKNGDRKLAFIKKIALLQPLEEISRPFRASDGYHIFYLSKRTDRILPITDGSVRHSIKRSVAREKARHSVSVLLKKLIQQADINVNPDYIKKVEFQ